MTHTTHMTHFPIETLMRARTILLYWEMRHVASCVMAGAKPLLSIADDVAANALAAAQGVLR